MNIDGIDRKLVDLLQVKFPFVRQPYVDIGVSLGISEEEVITSIRQLRANGIIRQISPVLAASSLGFKTTLVAMRVAEKRMGNAAKIIIQHPGVSHGYARDHFFNFWFTLATSSTADIEVMLPRLAEMIKAEAFFTLPAIRLFKLRTHFSLGGDEKTQTIGDNNMKVYGQQAKLSNTDRMIINELQQDLALVSTPFTRMSECLQMDEGEFLSQCQSLLARGIMRRYGAAINHRKAGYAANAMTCWYTPAEKVEEIGTKLASLRQVSHCYERETNPLWRYNIFAMIHSNSKKACQEIAEKVAAETGLTEYTLLLSTIEFKKTRVRYRV